MSKRSCDIEENINVKSLKKIKSEEKEKTYNHLSVKIKEDIHNFSRHNNKLHELQIIINDGNKLREFINASNLFCPEIIFSLNYEIIIEFVFSINTNIQWIVWIENKKHTSYSTLRDELLNFESYKEYLTEPVKIKIASYLNTDIITILKFNNNKNICFNNIENICNIETLIDMRNKKFVEEYKKNCENFKNKIDKYEQLILNKKNEVIKKIEKIKIRKYNISNVIKTPIPIHSYENTIDFYEKFYKTTIGEEIEKIKRCILSLKENHDFNCLMKDFLEINKYLFDIDLSYDSDIKVEVKYFIEKYENFVLETQKKLIELYKKIDFLIDSKVYTTEEINEKYNNIGHNLVFYNCDIRSELKNLEDAIEYNKNNLESFNQYDDNYF